jgi:hypothetical protein
MPRKVFTAGEVLAAADVNEFLMDQAVQSFASSAARGSAIPSPVTGMTTYLEDSKNLEIYDGSQYNSPSGLTLLATSSPSASGGINFNNVFSANYQNYQIFWNGVGSGAIGVILRLRVGGVDATTNYTTQFLEASSTVVSASRDTFGAMQLGIARATGRSFFLANISNPFAAEETSFTSSSQDPATNALLSLRSGSHTTATSYDGCTIFPTSGNFTGTIRIYGVKN